MVKTEKLVSISFLLLFMLALATGCANQRSTACATASPTPSLIPTPSPAATQPSSSGGAGSDTSAAGLVALAQSAPTRTPVPTASPDAIAEAADAIAQLIGLAGKTLLGLSIEDWFNLGGSLLIVLAAYLIGTWLTRWLFPRLVKRTKTDLDERLMQVSGNELRWLVVVVILRIATIRLDFISPSMQKFLGDVYFLLILLLSIVIIWRLINLVAAELEGQANKAGNQREAESLIILLVWGLRLIVLIIAISITLNHFGVNITGFAVLLGIIGLAISLAGRDVLADIIAGALILIDRPYRVGDRVGLGNIDIWGDVKEIGMVSTKVLTVDNRMVIVPNSKVRQNPIINFSYPDPSYYDTTDIGVAYDNDVEKVEQLLIKAAGSVDGVQKERGMYVRAEKFTRDQMIFRVGWWMKNNDEYYTLRQLVNRAIVKTLKDAGVVFPYRQERVDLEETSDKDVLLGRTGERK